MMTPEAAAAGLRNLLAGAPQPMRAFLQPYVDEACKMNANPAQALAALQAAGAGAAAGQPQVQAFVAALQQAMNTTTQPGGGAAPCGFIPALEIPGCPVKCDPCAYVGLPFDMALYSWPMIEDQLYSNKTDIDVVTSGAFPLNPGGSLTLSQQLNRTRTWIPDCVMISSTWRVNEPAQPGMLSYQWAVGPKDNSSAAVTFGEIQKGKEFECGDKCEKVPFPTWKGCSNLPIGPLASLKLIVNLSSTATSVLEGLTVVVYHRSSMPTNCGCGCGGKGSCQRH